MKTTVLFYVASSSSLGFWFLANASFKDCKVSDVNKVLNMSLRFLLLEFGVSTLFVSFLLVSSSLVTFKFTFTFVVIATSEPAFVVFLLLFISSLFNLSPNRSFSSTLHKNLSSLPLILAPDLGVISQATQILPN